MLQLTQLSGNLNFISELSDEPNIDECLSADQLKAKFDLAGNTIKQYINGTLLPQLVNGIETELLQATTPIAAEASASSAQLSSSLSSLSATVTGNYMNLLTMFAQMTDILHARIDALEAQLGS
ncbi:MAG: hypothetical protein LBQ91_00495 [Oscillospiraceae bacterium]|jgi:hypothetical protein|nr:hypothetical protein [Oscillospiraceae bacterium]